MTVINDCYNANPLSMRAALDDLATHEPAGAASPCSATCSSSAPTSASYHREIGAYAAGAGVDVLVTVGPLAAARCATRFDGEVHAVGRRRGGRARSRGELVEPGDVVLVKGSRGVGLEVVAEALARRRDGR